MLTIEPKKKKYQPIFVVKALSWKGAHKMRVSKFKVAFFENFSQTFNCTRGTRVSGTIPGRGSGGESHTH
jgi:hypothetical protein